MSRSASSALFRVQLEDGLECVAKLVDDLVDGSAASRVRAEASGLHALASHSTVCGITVPRVHLVSERHGLLVMDLLRPPTTAAHRSTFEAELGRGLALLHQASADSARHFGFNCDTFLGDSRQPNLGPNEAAAPTPRPSWPEFFTQYRLHAVLGNIHDPVPQLSQLADQILETAPQRLNTRAAEPCLLHGDLWSGNFFNTDAGPAFIDPAAYFGHREAEFGMTTLFGGLGAGFYRAYQDVWPLEPGWQQRVEIYQLYHLLNHLRLFGSGYQRQCVILMQAILGRQS